MKTNNKSTPGPWRIENHLDNVGPYSSARLEIWSNNRHIGNINEHVDDIKIDEANAALIAAAPEMLEALENALESLKYSVMVLQAPEKSTMRETITEIESVLKKARGKIL